MFERSSIMSESGYVHKQAHKVIIDNDQLSVKFCFKHELLEAKQTSLVLIQRGSENVIEGSIKQIDINEDFGIYESAISLTENK